MWQAIRQRRNRAPALALAAALTLTATLIRPGAAAAESNGGVRVMPLGDSITEGTRPQPDRERHRRAAVDLHRRGEPALVPSLNGRTLP
jgi:hypothetical protein